MAEVEVLTYLQMFSLNDLLRPPHHGPRSRSRRVDRTSPLIRRTTVGIGRAHQWPSQGWDDQQWQTYLRGPDLRHWVAFIHGAPAGLLTLDVPSGGEVEVDTFGLLPDHIGQGIGSYFLTLGVRLAWAVSPVVSRVWLHTTSRDHCHALPNYEERGFHRYLVQGSPMRQP